MKIMCRHVPTRTPLFVPGLVEISSVVLEKYEKLADGQTAECTDTVQKATRKAFSAGEQKYYECLYNLT